jgi:formylglycine-generating enzyme required for sulfatase activity
MKLSDDTALTCPSCGEPIQPHWKICPACETRLISPTCPRCGQPVKENWKRCPECEAYLVCSNCGRRLPAGSRVCPQCQSQPEVAEAPASRVIDSVTGIEFLLIPGGRFMMGDTFGDGFENELPVHEVELSPVYIAKYPVTQGQWLRVMPTNPAAFEGEERPVEQVSWTDVQTFLQKLADLNQARHPYRLPTEAEWEYAARSGGRAEKYAGGDQVESLAWFDENSDGETHPVGLKRPNGLGLYDMSGNVWEWCQDLFDGNAYTKHSVKKPVITAGGPDRVIRGGSWNLDAWSVRCARRFGFPPDYLGPGLGFRLAREADD